MPLSISPRLARATGIVVLGLYWFSVHPPGYANGYSEDMCSHEMARQMMAEELRAFGRPQFFSDSVMAPDGMSLPYWAGWNIERDWLGGYVWRLDPRFPFLWVLHGVSLLLSYLAVGWLIGRMGIRRTAAWALALLIVLFNVPRHMKLWHHSDNTMLHWIYAGFFLDAWIWQRCVRERRWSLHLEAWRALLLLGVFGTMGYAWGPDVIVWSFVRVGLLASVIVGARSGHPVALDVQPRRCAPPAALAGVLLIVQLFWFVPLVAAAFRLGPIPQGGGWPADLAQVIRPLWLDRLARLAGVRLPYPPYDEPETVVSIGWTYLAPLLLTLHLLRKRRGGPGLIAVAPFLAAILLALLYMNAADRSQLVVRAVSAVFPFMSFFRTWSRWGLFLPPLAGAVIVLAAPELERWWHRFARDEATGALRTRGIVVAAGFVMTALLELSHLARRVNAMPPLPRQARKILEEIKQEPGSTVLTLPFCVAGANAYCTADQCPMYPSETVTHCLRLFHDKKVYGSYASRLRGADCAVYDRPPFRSWMRSWKTQSCFDGTEWSQLCDYLTAHREIGAVLVFPDLWRAPSDARCAAELERRLGPVIAESALPATAARDLSQVTWTRMRWYHAPCRP